MLKSGITSLLLRLLTSGSRFVLVVALGRFLDVASLGRFGLVIVIVQLAIYVLGLDFYNYNLRELAKKDPLEWPRMIRDQALLHSAAVLIGFPLLLIVFISGALPWSLAIWVYPIVLGEHICSELHRMLIAMSRPVAANILLFFRHGIWVYALVGMMWLWPEQRALTTVLSAWVVGVILGFGVGAWVLRDLAWASVRGTKVNRAWLMAGLKIALPYLIASLSLRAVSTLERFALEHFWGEAEVGVFVLFYAIARLLVVATEHGVVYILLPRIIAAKDKEDRETFRALLLKLTAGIAGICAVAALGLVLGIGLVLDIVDKPVFVESLSTFWVLICATAMFALSYIPHCALYAAGLDRPIILSAVGALVVAVASVLWLVPAHGHLGAAYSALAAMTAIMVGKLGYVAWLRLKPSTSSSVS